MYRESESYRKAKASSNRTDGITSTSRFVFPNKKESSRLGPRNEDSECSRAKPPLLRPLWVIEALSETFLPGLLERPRPDCFAVRSGAAASTALEPACGSPPEIKTCRFTCYIEYLTTLSLSKRRRKEGKKGEKKNVVKCCDGLML